jgi:signal transduction histidine kinase
VTDFEPERWGADPKLVEVLGKQGAAEFPALFDGFPEAVGVLWAIRDDGGRIVDFSFGYGNPSILRAFRLPAATRDRYTLLEALPRMRGSRAFDAYVRVCDTGEPWVHEVTYDTPFGDGYMLGTWVQRSAKLGDGLVNFLTDVTAQRRMEADLRRYADVVAHDLSEPIAGIALLVRMLERRAEEPPSAEVLRQLRASTERARDLIEGVLVYAQAGELATGRVALGRLVPRWPRMCARAWSGRARRSRSASCRRCTATSGSSAACFRTWSGTPSSSAPTSRCGWRCRRCATARSGW